MASVVDIYNMALSQLRAGTVNSVDDVTVQAKQCALHYPIALEQALGDSLWGFNHAVTALAQLTEATVFGWTYCWQYPSDCVRINKVVRNLEDVAADTGVVVSSRLYDHRFRSANDLPSVEYRVYNVDGTQVIATKESELRIDYRLRVTNTQMFTAEFVTALASLLASMVAIPIVGLKDGRELRTESLTLYNAFKSKAAANSLNEQQTQQPESEYITVRE
jgi:hypothetical protein